jgi:DUF1680 family protein
MECTMSREPENHPLPDRRDFLRTASAATAAALLLPGFEAMAGTPGFVDAAEAARAGLIVRPFALTQVKLTESVFTQKRDRMLAYARGYGGASDELAGPDRVLAIFRTNAGLDTKGAQPVGSWENGTGYLRGHYAGHFMSMLAQAYAGTGDEVYKRKLDYMVKSLAECQEALAASAKKPTPRVAGKFGSGLNLSGSPIGLAEHVSLPAGVVSGLRDFTIGFWIKPQAYDPARLSDARAGADQAPLTNGSAVFDFGSPNPEYAAPALTRMFFTVRAAAEVAGRGLGAGAGGGGAAPVQGGQRGGAGAGAGAATNMPRFAITTSGASGEQRLDASKALPLDQWTHVAVTRVGTTATLYFDGQPVATNPNMTLSPADLGRTTGNWLGRCQFPQRNISYLNAQLDEFQIFDRGLSQADVQSLMTTAGGTVGGGNVVWYRFDEQGGMRATDSSGKGRHGTVVAPTDGRRHPGFLSAYAETQFIRLEEFATYGGNQGIWAPYYTLHKILAGLLDAHALTGNKQALDVASKIGDWVHSRLSKVKPEQFDRMWGLYIAGEYGGVNDAFATLHAVTKKSQYLAVARYFDNRDLKDKTGAGTDILDGRHANQHIPQFIGYLRVFEANNDENYHKAARNFWDMVVPHRTYAHGGAGVGEILRKRGEVARSLYSEPANTNHAETCVMYNMLKLSRNLFFHEPDPKYMNYYELGLINQILGSRRDNDSVTSPEVTYFFPVRPGARRGYGNTGTCCGGTGLENHTKYQDSIYFRSADERALYVNLYIPSVLDWKEKGFTIEQTTTYPLEGASTLVVRGNGRLALNLRVPSWVRKGYTVSINGSAQTIAATPGKYVTIDRVWKTGDRVEIVMPMSFRAEPTIDNPVVQSIYYGPTLLTIQAAATGTNTLEGALLPVSIYKHVKLSGDFASGMTPVAGKPLHFTLNGQTLAPVFVADPQAGQALAYHMYVRREEPQVVFGSVDSGVANPKRDDGVTFLDAVWSGAPFANHGQFVAAVERTAGEFVTAGKLTPANQAMIVQAARRAEGALV